MPDTHSSELPAPPLPQRLGAEAVGSMFLLVAVVGSGIMAQALSPDDVGLQLFENAAATAGALIALIWVFGGVSGAHFNPAVTLVSRLRGELTTSEALAYVGAQLIGGCVGTVIANVMFFAETDAFISISQRSRGSAGELVAEVVATFGLLIVIHGTARNAPSHMVAVAVGVWIGGAYFFTSSTSFANPMVSIARTLSDTFAGIQPSSAPGVIAMQLIGAVCAWGFISWIFGPERDRAPVTSNNS